MANPFFSDLPRIGTFVDPELILKPDLCGQSCGLGGYRVCRKESGCLACYRHAKQPRRYLISIGQISTDLKFNTIGRFLVLDQKHQKLDGMPCFRVPDLGPNKLYAITDQRRIVLLQKGDLIARKNYEFRIGENLRAGCSDMLIRPSSTFDIDGTGYRCFIRCLAFGQLPVKRQWPFKVHVPDWIPTVKGH